MPTARNPTPGHIAIAALGVAWAVLALHSLGAFGGFAGRFLDTWYYAGLILAAAVAVALRARASSGERRAWTLMAFALLAWAAGDLYWSLAVVDGSGYQGAWAFGAVNLAFYPLAYATLAILVRRLTDLTQRDLWLDGAIGAACAAAVALAVALPALSVDGDQRLEATTTLIYPALNVVLLGFVLVVLTASKTRPGARWLLLAAALGVRTVADDVYLLQMADGSYEHGGLLTPMWAGSALLIALAAWRSSSGARRQQLDRRQIGVPIVGGGLALAVIGATLASEVPDWAVVLAIATLLLAAVRMTFAFGEAERTLLESRRQALSDGLTNLGNRRRLLADLARVTDEATTRRQWVCVLLDLDGFKAYNDAFGHPAGDDLLMRLGNRLAAVAADHEAHAYRMGGDEFCLLAPCGADDAAAVVARAAAALSETGEAFGVTSSTGFATIPLDAREPGEVLKLADRRMYADKGRRASSAEHQSRAVLLRVLQEREPARGDRLGAPAELAVAVGRGLGLRGEQLDELARAAELHDIGKIALPEPILGKAGPLDDEERAFVERHPVIGERILSAAPALRPVARLVRSTHERYDGSGYPDGLRGEEIPLGSRIVAVCDAYAAMTAPRPYRDALTPEAALAELRRSTLTQFDPYVVEVFGDALDERIASEGVRLA